jgi:uncharacterized membrane protein YphA (DoxX/SURF4 family)
VFPPALCHRLVPPFYSLFTATLFLIPATLIFHTPLGGGFPAEQVQLQQAMMLKNLAIMGGLLAIVVYGAGELSLDAREGGAVEATPALRARS